MKTQKVHAVFTPKEGNNRTGALFHTVFAALFDAKKGSVVSDSMTTDWLIENLSLRASRDKSQIKANL